MSSLSRPSQNRGQNGPKILPTNLHKTIGNLKWRGSRPDKLDFVINVFGEYNLTLRLLEITRMVLENHLICEKGISYNRTKIKNKSRQKPALIISQYTKFSILNKLTRTKNGIKFHI
jgi:hypothetical protein